MTGTTRAAYSYRQDADVPAFAGDHPIIIFDGLCSLCSAWVQFALRHDRERKYRFIRAQSALGAALYRHFGLDPVDYETNILLADGVAYFKAEGTMRMIAGLGAPWSAIQVGRVLPAAWRDRLYELLARNRLRWFGRRESCMVPTPDVRERFLA